MVERISSESLLKLVSGQIKEKSTCVIKFYSNGCHYCHELKSVFETLSCSYDDVHFFAFNVADQKDKKIYAVSGVPTICLINTGPTTSVKDLSEPAEPDATTWYTENFIRKFIDKEKTR
jgi:thiol-disulfide isomerase/thioredoxin